MPTIFIPWTPEVPSDIATMLRNPQPVYSPTIITTTSMSSGVTTIRCFDSNWLWIIAQLPYNIIDELFKLSKAVFQQRQCLRGIHKDCRAISTIFSTLDWQRRGLATAEETLLVADSISSAEKNVRYSDQPRKGQHVFEGSRV